MTRLNTDMIKDIALNLPAYDDLIKYQTGLNLLQIGFKASGLEKGFLPDLNKISVAIVPVTAGLGKISRFAETVASILKFVGFEAFITQQSDIAGLGEAYIRRADLIFAADDEEFIAINTKSGKVVFNYSATADAFVIALDQAAEGVAEKEVLVIGAGKVGRIAINKLLQMKAKVLVYDVNEETLEAIKESNNLRTVKSLSEIGEGVKLLYDASPATDIINEEMIRDNSFIVSPGVPHGLGKRALEKINKRNFIHDNLILGTITMALQAIVD